MAALESVVRLVGLVAGLLGPGAAVLRALQLPRSLAGAFATSAVVLQAAVLGLAVSGLNVNLGSLSLVLLAVSLAALLASARSRSQPTSESAPTGATDCFPSGLGRGWPLYLIFWVILIFRAVTQPLSGPDVDFRWSWLAQEILQTGTLAFYPPHTAADFVSYFWPESIPPGIAALYAWAYACGGSFAAHWTTPVVLLQLVALHELLWRLGHLLGGTTAARLAVMAGAACPTLSWAFLIGQETGLTTIALLGLAYAALRAEKNRAIRWAVLTGLFAAAGASAREYGPVFPLFGALVLFGLPGTRRLLGWFLLAATPLTIAWLVRSIVRTGNPFYSLEVGTLFPTNAFFSAWRQFDRAHTGNPLTSLTGILAVLRLFALFAPAALLGWCALVGRRDRRTLLLLGGSLLFLTLWWWSVPYTVGGLFYSQRVAAPALALGAVATGLLLSRVRPAWAGAAAGTLLVMTLPHTLTLPENAWHIPIGSWPGLAREAGAAAARDEQTAAIVAALSGHTHTIAADNAGHQARLAARGIRVVPLWSPAVAWLFDPTLDAGTAREHWRRHPARYILLAKFEPSLAFLRPRARWSSPPFAFRIAWEDPYAVLFEIDLMAP